MVREIWLRIDMTRKQQIEQAAIAAYGTSDCRAAEHFVAGAVWSDEHPAWVSVEDELPKEWERVLCHGYEKWSKLGHGLIFVTCRVNKNNYSNYSHDGNGFVVNVPAPFKRVTHWMPLPKPPKKGD